VTKREAWAAHPAGATIFDEVESALGRQRLLEFRKVVLLLKGKHAEEDWRQVLERLAGTRIRVCVCVCVCVCVLLVCVCACFCASVYYSCVCACACACVVCVV
jgi:hypothetical protein